MVFPVTRISIRINNPNMNLRTVIVVWVTVSVPCEIMKVSKCNSNDCFYFALLMG